MINASVLYQLDYSHLFNTVDVAGCGLDINLKILIMETDDCLIE